MFPLHWQDACLQIHARQTLQLPQLTIEAGQCWAFVGGNGSGKTALARALCGELSLRSGQQPPQFGARRVSFEQQQQLTETEWQSRNTDMLGEEEEAGFTVASLMLEAGSEEAARAALRLFDIERLWDRPYRFLSSGEGRKLLLAQALVDAPPMLVLDEPFDGLDVRSRQELMARLDALVAAGQSLVLIVNRFDEIPAAATHLGLLSEQRLIVAGVREQVMASREVRQLVAVQEHPISALPAAIDAVVALDGPKVILKQLRIAYGDQVIIDGLDWTIAPGEQWQITGPNGAGKSTLLSVITGDHPQSYANDVTLFGRRRGSGESIWEIKRNIGIVSPALHLDYRVSCSVRTVILSGFYDSIGLYTRPGDRQTDLADEWLALIGLAGQGHQPFHSLSFGQQRLVLIARALVKHPPLLILDEPLQGLDPLNRHLVRSVLSHLIGHGETQVLFVSHHAEDAPLGLTHKLEFVPDGEGHYHYLKQPL